MKKILLSFVLLLACVGGWAQTVVTVINPLKKYTLECKAASGHTSARYILDADGTLNGQSATGSHFRFVPVTVNENTYYYIKSAVSSKYINVSAYTHQTEVTFDEEPATYWHMIDRDVKISPVKDGQPVAGIYLNNYVDNTCKLQLSSGTGGCSQWTLREYDSELTSVEIPDGFYRFKHVSSSKYLAAPEVLPTGNTSEQRYSVTLVDNIEENDKHRDVWYIENLGYHTDKTKGVMYRVWCFQGGYGLSCFGSPQVFGSFTKTYCPRLYSIVMTKEGKYTLAGHYYDTNSNPLGLDNSSGIGTKEPVKVAIENNTATFSRTGSSTDADSQWEIWPVAPISKSVTIGDIGVGTFAFNSEVKIPEGVEAYVAKTKSDDIISLTKLEGETIPARMGVVLRKTDDSKNYFTFEAVHGLGIGMKAVGTGGSETSVDDKGNLLVGTLAETQLAVGDYILTKKKVNGVATDEVVFGKITDVSKNIAANKAYLPAEAVSQTRGFYTLMWGDDVETGIEEIQSAVQKDGIFVEGQQIVIVKNGLKYNVKGQRVK